MSHTMTIRGKNLTLDADTDISELSQLLPELDLYGLFSVDWAGGTLETLNGRFNWYEGFEAELELLRKAGVRGYIELVRDGQNHEKYVLGEDCVTAYRGEVVYFLKNKVVEEAELTYAYDGKVPEGYVGVYSDGWGGKWVEPMPPITIHVQKPQRTRKEK